MGLGFGKNQELTDSICNYLSKHLLEKAGIEISKETKEKILQALIKGEQEGWGVDKIVYHIESDELSSWLLRSVIRTESLIAMQYGQNIKADNSRWQSENVWIAAHDHRTRHSHRDMDGKKVDVGQRFAVPIYETVNGVDIQIGVDMMLGPGDPTASPENFVNCRCSMRTVAKRDENGRLILKSNV
jgi:uncharacterized protein with gpF-like domain